MPENTPGAYELQHLCNECCCGYIRLWDAIFGKQALGTVAVDRPVSHQSADMYTVCSHVRETGVPISSEAKYAKILHKFALKTRTAHFYLVIVKAHLRSATKDWHRTKASLVLLLPPFPDKEILRLVKRLESLDLSSLVS